MSPFFVYLMTRVDTLRDVCFVLFLGGGLLSFILTGFSFDCDFHDSERKTIVFFRNIAVFVFVVSLFLFTFVPSKKDVVVIYALPKLATEQNIEKLSSLTANGIDVVSESLNWLRNAIGEKGDNK